MNIVNFFRHAAQRFWQPKPENSFVFRANEAPEQVRFPKEFAQFVAKMRPNEGLQPGTVDGHVIKRHHPEGEAAPTEA